MQSGPVPQANQTRPANYKYTANMRNPPAQNVAIVPQAAPVQAVHVKGLFHLILHDFLKKKQKTKTKQYFSNLFVSLPNRRSRTIDSIDVGCCTAS